MRGGAMDDVIFAGTDTRPGRNMAEVSIALDNRTRRAPAEFNDTDVIEISRRIQREAGSVYKLNGKDVRARDVQLLFADAATGSRSQALVQQGRIGEIISAKPQDRRRILEDAAGIAGLHGRRHEAELRLKQAEANLERLRDVLGQLGTQLANLRRQARQAQRYKEISAELRKCEGIQHHLQWSTASAQVAGEEAALLECTRAVGQLTQAESSVLRSQTEIAELIQPLREEEATRAAVLHRLEVERETLDREEARAKQRQAEMVTRMEQLQTDIDRETEAMGEAKELLARLDEEEENLRGGSEDHAAAQEELRDAVADAAEALSAAEEALQVATAQAASARAVRSQAEARIRETSQKAERFTAQASELERQISAAGVSEAAAAEIEELMEAAEHIAAAAEEVEQQMLAAEAALPQARAREKETRDIAAQARMKARQLETEIATLVKLLKPADSAKWKPVVDEIRVGSGYEAAIAAALGDDLEAGLDPNAPMRWHLVSGEDDPALPSLAEPLSDYVSGPAELARTLGQIGVVSREHGALLQAQLKPGQRLVSLQGDLWRWDGFTSAADSTSAAAQRLAERNRLGALEEQLAALQEMADQADDARDAAAQAAQRFQADEKTLRDRWRQMQSQLSAARDKLGKVEKVRQESNTKLAGLREALSRVREAAEDALADKAEAEAALDGLAADTDLDARLDAAKIDAGNKRSAFTNIKSQLDGLERELRAKITRLDAITQERNRWLARGGNAEAQLGTLHQRLSEVRSEIDALHELPAKIEARRQKILNEISEADSRRKEAAIKLAEAEHAVRDQERAIREAQAQLSQAREQRARIEARLEGAREKRRDLARIIRELFECSAEDTLSVVGIAADTELPDLADVEQSIVKLKADRERLGGVNLRAEEEAQAMGAEHETMERERAELEEAIAKLRQGIINLNKEGRKRLVDAFQTVNGHFQRLFKVLFGGGSAELQLIESDDPLESGLELLCCPPGKKPQVLTLLSGGEKALTALALIFAVFQTNPSPICVLDEVDAPLDDANTHRMCAMLEEMRKTTDTRFLTITHNPITMAAMDRLFGVTMQEKGVSQLVSVDLQTAERFREAVA
jgi:chromosome segregation protein